MTDVMPKFVSMVSESYTKTFMDFNEATKWVAIEGSGLIDAGFKITSQGIRPNFVYENDESVKHYEVGYVATICASKVLDEQD